MENPSAPRSLTKSLTLSKDPDLPILFTKRSIQEFGTVPLTYREKFGRWISGEDYNSFFLHSGLNLAWHFWLSTRFSCCLKMKSVENILGYIQPQENLWNCSRKYPKMFKTDSFLGNKKSSLNQNVWRNH